MTNYEDIRGALPYKESPAYIEGLVDRCRKGAVEAASVAPAPVIRPWMYGIAAALVAAIVTLAVTLAPRKAPMDRFLAGISDEEASLIVSYDIEEIPYINE